MAQHGLDLIFNVFGVIIIILAIMVKVPQIVKIYKAESGAGITKLGNILELTAYTLSSAYSYHRRLPLLKFGELILLAIQTDIVYLMILYYDWNYTGMVIFAVIYVPVSTLVMSGIFGNTAMSSMQALAVVLSSGGKLAQVKKNYTNKHTGQLSNTTMVMLTFMGVTRVFTTVMAPNRDLFIIANFICLSAANIIILVQIFVYRSNTATFRRVDAFNVQERKSRSKSKNRSSSQSHDDKDGQVATEGFLISLDDMKKAGQEFSARKMAAEEEETNRRRDASPGPLAST
ncbi:Mannose-P-dolichol utilization defect 1 -like protein [Halotydeus destructor]|nr:Mannose-P-dolichol utilization defect 1 -like protein [Halotydeus destructor]